MNSENTTTKSEQDSPPPIVRLVRVCKSFGRHEVLENVTLNIPEGLTTVILGPSGAGKSVLLKNSVVQMYTHQFQVLLIILLITILMLFQFVEIYLNHSNKKKSNL